MYKDILSKIHFLSIVILLSIFSSNAQQSIDNLPVRGFTITAPRSNEVNDFVDFVTNDLSKTPVNTIFLRINYNYKFKSHPELADKQALSKKEIQKMVNACRENGIKLIPIVNLLGHQSWKQDNIKSLLRVYPEFEENPGEDLYKEDFYCRSYCPLHPEVHKVVFALVDELIDVFETDGLHVGMDEVFVLGSDACPRCKGKDKAVLFAEEMTRIYEHLKSKDVKMYMWGDRLIDGFTTGLGKWSASENYTHTAIDMIPKDIVICDWHYKTAPPTDSYFAIKGFNVISCSFHVPEVGLEHLKRTQSIRSSGDKKIGERMLGVMPTFWGSYQSFIKCYRNEKCQTDKIEGAIQTFRVLYE